MCTFRSPGAVLALVMLMFSMVYAQPEPSSSVVFVKSVLDKAMDIQTNSATAGEAQRGERARMIKKLIADNFLSEEMARNSLGSAWDGASAQQRSEFKDLFVALFQDSYTRMVLNFLEKEAIEYGEGRDDAQSAEVKTTIMRANEHIPVDYALKKKGNQWFIEDVVIDGVSIVDNYRTSFIRVIKSSSFEELLKKLRVQKKSLESAK